MYKVSNERKAFAYGLVRPLEELTASLFILVGIGVLEGLHIPSVPLFVSHNSIFLACIFSAINVLRYRRWYLKIGRVAPHLSRYFIAGEILGVIMSWGALNIFTDAIVGLIISTTLVVLGIKLSKKLSKKKYQ